MVVMLYASLFLLIILIVIYKLKILNLSGSFVAFLMGLIFLYSGGLIYIFTLFIFLGLSGIATKYRYDYKKNFKTNEMIDEVRKAENVLANGFSPLIFAIFGFPIGFFGAVATALSDTMASEIGILSNNAYLMVNFKKVKPGSDGAVSIRGTFFSILGAGVIAFFYFIIYNSWINGLIILISGFTGCLMDSFLGSTLERKKIIGKSHVNLAATFFGGLVALFIFYVI